MSFKLCDQEIKSGIFASLKGDGDQMLAVFIAEPLPRPADFMGKERVQAMFAVVTPEGLKVWSVSARSYQYLRTNWKHIVGKPQLITRHGKPKSQDTYYEFKAVPDQKELAATARRIDKAAVTDIYKAVLNAEHAKSGGKQKSRRLRKPKV